MSDKKTIENKPYRFITKAFKDKSEVLVLKGKGKIDSIEEKQASGTGQVKFQIFTPGENPKALRPEGGWFSLENTEMLNYLKQAQAEGREVTYRIEVKRRPNIAADIPFEDLYQSMDAAKENTVRIIALVDNVESTEAVTLPSEDPVFAGAEGKTISEMQAERDREQQNAANAAPAAAAPAAVSPQALLAQLKALSSSGDYPDTIVDTLAGLALASGATLEQVNAVLFKEGKGGKFKPADQHPRSFAKEAPRWEEYNSDGRINLGSGHVASGVSIEVAVSKNLFNGMDTKHNPSKIKGFEEVVAYLVDLSYAICDFSQQRMYGTGFRVERRADSHTRIRGLFIDLVERFCFFPVVVQDGTVYIKSEEEVDEWIKQIGGNIIKRFTHAVNASYTYKSFAALRAELDTVPVLNRSTPAQPQAAPVAPQAPAQPQAAPVAPQAPAQPQAAPVAPQAAAQPQAAPVAPQAAAQPQAAPVAPQAPAQPQAAPVAPQAAAQPQAAPDVSAEPRASLANEIIKNFVPTEGIYSGDDSGLISAEEEDVDYEFVTNNVIKFEALDRSHMSLPTEADIENFKTVLDALGFNLTDRGEQILIGKMISFTFGEQYKKLKEVPQPMLSAFEDWYSSAGSEAINELRSLAAEAYRS